MKLVVGDISGTDSFVIEDYVGSFTTGRAVDVAAMDYGLQLCAHMCDGALDGTSPPGAGDDCGGVPCGVAPKPIPPPSTSGGGGSGGSGGSSGSGSGTNGGTNGGTGSDGGSNSAGGDGDGTKTVTPASCSTGVVNAAGDGCDASTIFKSPMVDISTVKLDNVLSVRFNTKTSNTMS